MPPRLAERVRGMTLPVRTPRLRLVSPRRVHVPELVALLNERAITRWTLHIPHPYTRADSLEFLRRSRLGRRSGRWLNLVMVREEDRKVVGAVGLHHFDEGHSSAEVGYWVGRPYWRQGFAREASIALVSAAFRDLGLHRVEARVFVGNTASVHLLRRLGFRYEGRVRGGVQKRGRWVDELRFARLESDRLSPTARRKKP
jgi:[ribosomal protein S5]-alanine N-acetyltransferase